MITKMTPMRRTTPWTTGKSLLRMQSTVYLPMPGHAKTVSVSIAPPRSEPSCRPMTVVTGSMAFLRA